MSNNAKHSAVILSAFIFLSALVAPASAQASSPAPAGAEGAPINAFCLVTTDEPVKARLHAVYQGHVIGFCCKKCRRKFEEDPEAYVANLPMLQPVAFTQTDKDNDAQGNDDHGDNPVISEAEPAHDGDAHTHESHPGSAGADTPGHDHATDHDDESRSHIITWFGNFHPPATDLPVGMLLGAALAEGLFIVSSREIFKHAAVFCVVITTVGAVTAAPVG